MGKARELVSKNIEHLRVLAQSGHAPLRDYAIEKGLDNPAGFNAYKKELRAAGIDYDELRAALPMQTLLAAPALKERGWTEGLMKRFLGEPDELRDNPRYRSAAPLRLYAAQRVEAAEATPEFAAARKGSARRSVSAEKAAETRRTRLLAEVDALQVTVPALPRSKLLNAAIQAYNDYNSEYAFDRNDFYYVPATAASDDAFLTRIQVNYLRHTLSRYDRHLEDVAGKTGVAEAVCRIREKVYAAIAEAYPEFADECHRQLAARTHQD